MAAAAVLSPLPRLLASPQPLLAQLIVLSPPPLPAAVMVVRSVEANPQLVAEPPALRLPPPPP